MKLLTKRARTSKIVDIFVLDSASAIGGGLTGLVYNSAGLTAYYKREGDASMTQISLVTATGGTWASGGFIVTDATNAPGSYELHLPNAAIATGADTVFIYLHGAVNMAPVVMEIQLNAGDVVWDEPLTGATHNVSTSSGRRLRQLESGQVVRSDTAQDGSNNTITLDAGADSADDFYEHMQITIIGGTGVGQSQIIVRYTGSSKIAEVAHAWHTNPTGGSVFAILPGAVHTETSHSTLDHGMAQAGASGTITLRSGASAIDDFYKGGVIVLDTGTGGHQCRLITGYTGSSRIATITPNWKTNPAADSEYDISCGSVNVRAMADGVITAAALDTSAVNEIRDGILNDAIRFSGADIGAIKAVTDALPDAGALTSIAQEATLDVVGVIVAAIKAVTDALPDAGALTTLQATSTLIRQIVQNSWSHVGTLVTIQNDTDSGPLLTFTPKNKNGDAIDSSSYSLTTPAQHTRKI